MDWAYTCCGKEQPNNTAHLPKYTVHSRGATKPPSPESPRTASLKRTLVLCLAYSITVLLFCVAIAACGPFDGVTTFDSY